MISTYTPNYLGCLLGLALGDAIGSPIEGPHDPSTMIDAIRRQDYRNIIREHGGHPIGQVTDDTQLSIDLAEALLEPELEPAFKRRLLSRFASLKAVGYGGTTMRAVQNIALHRTPSWIPSGGNGAVMRAAPVGLVHHSRKSICEVSRRQAEVTHLGKISTECATFQAGIVSELLREGYVSDAVETADFLKLGSLLGPLRKMLSLGPNEAQSYVLSLQNSSPSEIWRDGLTPYALSTTLWAYYAFHHHRNDSFDDVICLAIRPGGDVDSTASMAGALFGACRGTEGMLDHPLAQKLHDGDQHLLGYLQNLAHRLEEHVEAEALRSLAERAGSAHVYRVENTKGTKPRYIMVSPNPDLEKGIEMLVRGAEIEVLVSPKGDALTLGGREVRLVS